MINTAEHEKKLRNAYYLNRYKQLVVVTISEGHEPDDLIEEAGGIPSNYTLDQQVVYQASRTYYRSSYGGEEGAIANGLARDFDIDRIKEWLDHLPSSSHPCRVIAYSAFNKATLNDVYWSDSPFNDTGGIYGLDTNKPGTHYEFPKGLPKNLGIGQHVFKSLLNESKTVSNASTVRWTDTIPECRAANALISLGGKCKLLDMDELLIKL